MLAKGRVSVNISEVRIMILVISLLNSACSCSPSFLCDFVSMAVGKSQGSRYNYTASDCGNNSFLSWKVVRSVSRLVRLRTYDIRNAKGNRDDSTGRDLVCTCQHVVVIESLISRHTFLV